MQISETLTKLIYAALEEDIGKGDVTAEATVTSDLLTGARILSKQSGVLAGGPVAQYVFLAVDNKLKIRIHREDGSRIRPKTDILEIEGNAKSILRAERVALNLLSHASGIATLTHRFVEKVKGTKAKILDTRKTMPLWRELDRYAVRMGGGENHRFNLNDMILIKENHIAAAGGIESAIRKSLAYRSDQKLQIILECRSVKDVKVALNYPVDRLLLDHVNIQHLKEAVKLCQGKIPLEASGNVTLENVRTIAHTGVDFISIGAITHSAPAFDFTLLIN